MLFFFSIKQYIWEWKVIIFMSIQIVLSNTSWPCALLLLLWNFSATVQCQESSFWSRCKFEFQMELTVDLFQWFHKEQKQAFLGSDMHSPKWKKNGAWEWRWQRQQERVSIVSTKTEKSSIIFRWHKLLVEPRRRFQMKVSSHKN